MKHLDLLINIVVTVFVIFVVLTFVMGWGQWASVVCLVLSAAVTVLLIRRFVRRNFEKPNR